MIEYFTKLIKILFVNECIVEGWIFITKILQNRMKARNQKSNNQEAMIYLN